MSDPLLLSGCVVLIYVTIAWTISAAMSRADIVDPFWGPGFLVIVTAVAWHQSQTTAPTSGQPSPVNAASTVFLWTTGIWGMRLGIHLFVRWLKEPHEDRRYAAMRAAGTKRWWLRSLFTVFWLQGLIMWIVSLPLQLAILSSTNRSPILLPIGLCLFVAGLFFEAVGDWQLTKFRNHPESHGKVMNTGLWRYTRHPNYFGDFAAWWGLFTISLYFGSPFWTVVSPLIMSAFLMKYSGVGMLEKDINSRRPGYAEYCQQTNTFWPWFPKKTGPNHGSR